jgi:hypothetical protein
LEAPVKSTVVSGRFSSGFRTDLHFADESRKDREEECQNGRTEVQITINVKEDNALSTKEW